MADLAIALELTGRDAGASAAANQVAGSLRNVGDSAEHATQKSGGLGSALGNVAAVAGGFVVARGLMELPGFLVGAGKAAAEEETGIKRLAQAVDNAGGSWEAQGKDIEGVIAQREKLGFSDDKLRSSLALLDAQTGDVGEGMSRQKLAMDLARGANIDLESASRLLGKASEENVGVLQRLGVRIEKGAGLTELFGAVQEKFGGQAEAAAGSAAVQWEIFSNQMDNLKEDIGSALLPVMTTLGSAAIGVIDDLRASGDLQNIIDGMTGAFSTLGEIALQAFNLIRAALSSDLFQGLVEQVRGFAAAVQSGFDLVASVVSAVLAGDIEVAIQTLEDSLDIDLSPFIGAFQTAFNFVQQLWQQLTDAWVTVQQVLAGDWEASAGIDPFVNALGIAVTFIRDTAMPAIQTGITAAFTAAGDAIAGVTSFLEEHKAVQAGLVGVLGAAAAAWALMTAATIAHGIAANATAIATGAMTAAQWLLNAALTANPIGIVVVALAGLVAALIFAYQTSDEFRAFVDAAFTAVQAVITTVVTAVTTLITDNWTTIQTVTTVVWTVIKTLIETTLTLILGVIRTAMLLLTGDWTGAWEEIQRLLKVAWDAMVVIIEQVGVIFLAAVAAIWKAIQDAVPAAWAAIQGAITGAWESIRLAIANTAQSWLDTGTNMGAALMQGIKDFITGAIPGFVKQMTDAAGQALEGVRGLFGAGAAGGGRGGSVGGVDIDAIAQQVGISGGLLRSLIQEESGGNQGARSPVGAIGLTQLMPGTAAGLGVNPYDPYQNVLGGATYLKQLIDQFGNLERALIAYNAGPAGGAPSESVAYAGRVIAGASVQRGGAGGTQVSQYDLGLPIDQADAACGPAALYWFMNQTGRTPTASEAVSLAQAYGWDASRGMYGPTAFANAAAAIPGITAQADFTPTREEIAAALASGNPFALSTGGIDQQHPGHYFQVQGGTLGGLNVGGSGTALKGGADVMSIDQIERMTGAVNGIITVYGTLGRTATEAGGAVASANADIASSLDGIDPHAEQIKQQMESLQTAIGQGFPEATGKGTAELKAFGEGAQLIFNDLASHNIAVDDAAQAMIRLASSTGLTIAPAQQMEAGLIGQDQALAQVLATAAEVNPSYANIAAGFIEGATGATQTTLDFIQLAASSKGVTDAVIPADQALRTMAGYMPTVSQLAIDGALSGDQLSATLIGLSNSSGLVKSNLDLQTASSADLNAEISRIIDEIAIVDPRFQALADTIKTEGGVTAETTGQFVNLLDTIDNTPDAVDPAITAHQNLGTAATIAQQTTQQAWETILREIAASVKSIDDTVKRLADAVIKYLGMIDDERAAVHVDTSTAVKNLTKLENKADDAWEAIKRLADAPKKSATSKDVEKIFGFAGGGDVQARVPIIVGEHGPELFVPRSNGYIVPNDELSSGGSRLGGGGGTAIYATFVNHGVLVASDADDWLVDSLKRLRREGRMDGIDIG